MDRLRKPKREKVQASPEEKEIYLEEAHNFSLSLVEDLNDQDGTLWSTWNNTNLKSA